MGQVPEESAAGDLDVVLGCFGLGGVASLRGVAEGLMNRNWAVTASGGRRVFVKQVVDVDAARARAQHAATRALAQAGLPVAAPLATTDGETLVEVGGGLFVVYPWVEGHHVAGVEMTPAQATELGGVLARLHRGLGGVMPPAGPSMTMPVTDSAAAKHALDTYGALLAERGERDGFDRFVAGELPRRRKLLEAVEHLRPDGSAAWSAGWVHGDFHDLNVLWDAAGSVAAVVDFDRLAVKPYAGEVVRAVTLMFAHGDDRGVDLRLAAAFADGYRAVLGVDDDALRAGLRWLWWERVCDFWQLKRHYLGGDDTCDHLFRSASALLWWWTGHRAEVEAAITSR